MFIQLSPERLERDRRQDHAAHPQHDVQNHEAARLLGHQVDQEDKDIERESETPLRFQLNTVWGGRL